MPAFKKNNGNSKMVGFGIDRGANRLLNWKID